MKGVGDIFRDPTFKKDFALIKQLENNKGNQEKIWKKFLSTYSKKTEMNKNTKHKDSIDSRFDSHPSGLTSDSEESLQEMKQYLKQRLLTEASYVPSTSTVSKKKDAAPIFTSGMFISELERSKLRKKMTHHLNTTGTLDQFEIRAMCAHRSTTYKEKQSKGTRERIKMRNTKKSENDTANEPEQKDLEPPENVDSSSVCSTPKSSSDNSMTNNQTEVIDIPISPKIEENTEENNEENTGENNEENTEENNEDNIEENTEEKTEEDTEEDAEENTVDNIEDITEDITEDNTETRTDEKEEQVNIPTTKSRDQVKRPKPVKIKENPKVAPISPSAELRKSRNYIEKSIATLKEIGNILTEGIIKPDGSEDYNRRHLRAREFISRFARVYNYPLMKQLTEVSTMPMGKRLAFFSKFSSMYQLIHQALQAYFSHIPATVAQSSYHKLKEHLKCIINVCDRNTNFFNRDKNIDNNECIRALKAECVNIIHHLEDLLSQSAESQSKSKSTTGNSDLSESQNIKRHSLSSKKDDPNKRFSMYRTSVASSKDKHWRRMLEMMEARKPKVQSRYRTATFKHRPPIEKPQTRPVIHRKQHRLDDKRSLTILRNTPIASPVIEDNIQTMIEYEKLRDEALRLRAKYDLDNLTSDREDTIKAEPSDPEGDKSASVPQEKDDILAKLLQLAQEDDARNPEESGTNLSETIKVLQQCLDFKKHNLSPLKEKESEDSGTLPTIPENKEDPKPTDTTEQKKDPVLSKCGAKNAQLICMKDDSSVQTNDCSIDEHNKPIVPQNSPRKARGTTKKRKAKSKLVLKNHIISIPSITSMKRVDKPKKPLQVLSKNYAVTIIQHRLLFENQHRVNHMYKKKTAVKPWEVMDTLTDILLDFVFLDISTEIEVSELLDDIYSSEFLY